MVFWGVGGKQGRYALLIGWHKLLLTSDWLTGSRLAVVHSQHSQHSWSLFSYSLHRIWIIQLTMWPHQTNFRCQNSEISCGGSDWGTRGQHQNYWGPTSWWSGKLSFLIGWHKIIISSDWSDSEVWKKSTGKTRATTQVIFTPYYCG